jgi:release factor glutamine methyltransferase
MHICTEQAYDFNFRRINYVTKIRDMMIDDFHQLPTKDRIISTSFQALNIQAENRARNCHRAPMPTLDHLNRSDYDLVYEPSEDTFLLLDALRYDFECPTPATAGRIRSIGNTLEIGCGTGVATIYLLKLIQDLLLDGSNHYVTDVNSDAIRITLQTAQSNDIPPNTLTPLVCHLATPLLSSASNKVHILLFNPPYVPTPDEEVGRSTGLEASWAGGVDGRRVIDEALPQIASLLSKDHGVAYMIVVDDNRPEEITQRMKNQYGITAIPWLRRKARNEFLTVLKMTPDGT